MLATGRAAVGHGVEIVAQLRVACGSLVADVVRHPDEEASPLGQDGAVIKRDRAVAFKGAAASARQLGPTGHTDPHGSRATKADFETAGHGPGAREERSPTHGLVEDGGEKAAMDNAGETLVLRPAGELGDNRV